MPFSPEQKSILQSGAESDQELTTEQVPGVGADEFHRDGAYKNSEALSGANEHHIYGAYLRYPTSHADLYLPSCAPDCDFSAHSHASNAPTCPGADLPNQAAQMPVFEAMYAHLTRVRKCQHLRLSGFDL